MIDSQIPLRLSQGHLNVLERCPRQFQHSYLNQLTSPANPESQERLTLGSRFHLLMQQREMGLPIEPLLQQDTELQRCMVAFAEIAPDIFLAPDGQMFRESEHYRTLQIQDYLLTVVYDLLIADGAKAQILDWKTYPKPANKEKLASNWQTLLYLYVLAETSDYQPEQISMTYWFIQSEGKLQNIKFNYSHAQHIATTKKLDSLLCQLTNCLQADTTDPFPQVPIGSKICDKCQYISRCGRDFSPEHAITDRTTSSNSVDSTLLNLATIQEVTL